MYCTSGEYMTYLMLLIGPCLQTSNVKCHICTSVGKDVQTVSIRNTTCRLSLAKDT